MTPIELMFASSNFPPKKLPIGNYIYLHKRVTDGRIFYVGKGKGNRAWRFEARTNEWKVEAYHYGHLTEIMMEDVPIEQIDKLERATILMFQFMGHPLVNIQLIRRFASMRQYVKFKESQK